MQCEYQGIFIPKEYQGDAYNDSVPIGYGQTISRLYRMTDVLRPEKIKHSK
jgi:protein-L-isoaspartate O-methyltransferase